MSYGIEMHNWHAYMSSAFVIELWPYTPPPPPPVLLAAYFLIN